MSINDITDVCAWRLGAFKSVVMKLYKLVNKQEKMLVRVGTFLNIIDEYKHKYIIPNDPYINSKPLLSELALLYNKTLQVMSVTEIQDHDTHGWFVQGTHERPAYTAFYIMLYNKSHCYSLNPKDFYEKWCSDQSSKQFPITQNLEAEIQKLVDKHIINRDAVFNILEQVEAKLTLELRKFKASQASQASQVKGLNELLENWDWQHNTGDSPSGGSRKRRKSICKNYNKKCKHYTKKHKIIHKKTKRQKYQKRK